MCFKLLNLNTPFKGVFTQNVMRFVRVTGISHTLFGMTTRHLDTRAKEQLHSKYTKSAIYDHTKVCKTCMETEHDINTSQKVL